MDRQMRKCRIYDKKLKIIRDVKLIDFKNGEVMFYADDLTERKYQASLDIVRGLDEVNIMWSTSLKDEKGIDIYEGDLIEYRDGEESFRGKVEISCFGTYAETEGDYISFEHFSDENTGIAGNCYIVGNVYENQE